MKKIIVLILIVILVALGVGYSIMSQPKANVLSEQTTSQEKQAFVADKTFDIKGLDFTYDVKEIKVKLNDKVKINFTNTEGFHDFKIDELGVDSGKIKVGESKTVEFVASKVGTFEYYCSVGQHRANGMWGKIIVE